MIITILDSDFGYLGILAFRCFGIRVVEPCQSKSLDILGILNFPHKSEIRGKLAREVQ